MARAFSILALLFLASSSAHAGVWQVLASTVYRVANPACSSASSENVQHALDDLQFSCSARSSSTGAVLNVAKAVDDDAESVYFGLLAKQYAVNLSCVRSNIAAMIPKAKPITDDLNAKLGAMVELENKLEDDEAAARKANHNIDLAPVLRQSRAALSAKARAAENEVQRVFAQIATIRAAIPFSDQPEMSRLIDHAVWNGRMKHRSDGLVQPTEVSAALSDLSKRLETDRQRMTSAAAHKGEGLTDNDRHQLSEDSRLQAEVENQADKSDRPALQSLACHVNARWGKGQDELDATLAVGGLGLSAFAGVGRLVLEAPALAAAADTAVARGLITLSQSRIVMASALALNSASAYRNVDHACQTSNHVAAQCGGADPLKSLQSDNCYLALALNGLGFALSPGVKLAKSRALWKRLIAGHEEFEPDLPPPELPASESEELNFQQQVEHRLGRTFTVDDEEIPSDGPLKMPGHKIQLYDAKGKTVGSFIYYTQSKKEEMIVGKVMVNQVQDRKKGVSEFMFSEILARHPEIRHVDTVLTDTNQKILVQALDEGLSCMDAIKTTPAYKMRAKFGFTVITEADCESYMSFVVSRP